MEDLTMPVRCNLKLLMARENVARLEQGREKVTMRSLAEETGLALSSLAALSSNHSQRIDYKTIDRLCAFFNCGVGDLLVWEAEATTEALQ